MMQLHDWRRGNTKLVDQREAGGDTTEGGDGEDTVDGRNCATKLKIQA